MRRQVQGIAAAIDFVGSPHRALGIGALRKGGRYVLVTACTAASSSPLPPIASAPSASSARTSEAWRSWKEVVALAKRRKIRPRRSRPAPRKKYSAP